MSLYVRKSPSRILCVCKLQVHNISGMTVGKWGMRDREQREQILSFTAWCGEYPGGGGERILHALLLSL